MNPEVKAKWVQALRSGEYKQGVQRLRCEDGSHCCLGVLCDIHSKECDGEWVGTSYYGSSTYLPREVVKWAGLSHDSPRVVPKDMHCRAMLADINDDGYSFDTIADLIEAQL